MIWRPYVTSVMVFACAVLSGCGGGEAGFSGSPASKIDKGDAKAAGSSPDNAPAHQLTETFSFALSIAGGRAVVAPGAIAAQAQVFLNDSVKPIPEADAKLWTVSYSLNDHAQAPAALGTNQIDGTALRGMTRVEANFLRRTDQRTGRATQSIFVDGEPPRGTLIDLGADTVSGDEQLFWSAYDNYALDESKTTLFVCPQELADLDPTSIAAAVGCNKISEGPALYAKGARLSVPAGAGKRFYLLAVDSVGLKNLSTAETVAKAAARLTLEATTSGTIYSNQTTYSLPLKLTRLESGSAKQVPSASDPADRYVLQVASGGADAVARPFEAPASLDLIGDDRTIAFVLQAQDTSDSSLSNRINMNVILDRTPPEVSAVKVDVRDGFLDPTTPVTVTWNAGDANGLRGQVLAIRWTGNNDWVKIADVDGTERSAIFTWGADRPIRSFEARITATDAAGNTSESLSAMWSPQIFNAAVLTSSVECFFCHIRVEGLIGGINFPASSLMHVDAGENLQATHGIYATNTIPSQLKQPSITSPSLLFENYTNTPFKIFPSNTSSFPSLSVAYLEPKMDGSIRNGDGTRVARVHRGNLILSSQPNHPIEISGQVLITGDLVIKGTYRGIGSIYARRIYIVDDIVSEECATLADARCPFPFEHDQQGNTRSDDEIKARAREAIALHRSALHLGAIDVLLAGDLDHGFDGTVGAIPPPDGMTKAEMEALGRQAFWLKSIDGSNFILPTDVSHILDPTTSPKVNINVERVDAYLYGGNAVVWRSYGNFLINGGFMGYRAALVSSFPYQLLHRGPGSVLPVNPRNGLDPHQNTVRYDYRLRWGGAGFEALKRRFDED